MPEPDDKIIRMQSVNEGLRQAFLGWQCRLRQLAVRENEARPSPGMRPALEVASQNAGAITVVLTPIDPKNQHGRVSPYRPAHP